LLLGEKFVVLHFVFQGKILLELVCWVVVGVPYETVMVVFFFKAVFERDAFFNVAQEP
jgi:hypothetical protein